MNPLLLGLTDGTSFFAGLATVALCDVLLLGLENRIARGIAAVLLLVGIVLVLASATPIPLWLYALWTVAVVGSRVVSALRRPSRTIRIKAVSAVVATSIALGLIELPNHSLPPPVNARGRTVYVLGDSLSAGAGGTSSIRHWPAVLADRESLDVVNLAQPGATIESAMKQTEGIANPASVVIVEIGGNDLLGSTAPADFRRRLDALLASLSADGHDIVVFELPLLPFQNLFGRAQRDLAAKHGAILIPKRILTSILATTSATLDGLHLSQTGHDAMAESMARIVRGEEFGKADETAGEAKSEFDVEEV